MDNRDAVLVVASQNAARLVSRDAEGCITAPAAARRQIPVLLLLVLSGASASGCGGPAPAPPQTAATAPLPQPSAVTQAAEEATASTGECGLLAATLEQELSLWTGSPQVLSAPVHEDRLGPQGSDGLPGTLTGGCVWEGRGDAGGHIGVAVEQLESMDLDALGRLADDRGVRSDALPGARQRWTIPGTDDTPSGAVVVVDGDQALVVRVESYSNDGGRTFVSDVVGRSDAFFRRVGDAAGEAEF